LAKNGIGHRPPRTGTDNRLYRKPIKPTQAIQLSFLFLGPLKFRFKGARLRGTPLQLCNSDIWVMGHDSGRRRAAFMQEVVPVCPIRVAFGREADMSGRAPAAQPNGKSKRQPA